MFSKTTSNNFKKYGRTFREASPRKSHKRSNSTVETSAKKVEGMYFLKEDLYFKVQEGIALLLVANKDDCNTIEAFVVHQVVQIYKNNYFNFIAITDNVKIELSSLKKIEDTVHPLKSPFYYHPVVPTAIIKEIYSYYYVVRSTNYFFPGEAHSYFELTMVDSGVLYTKIDGKRYTLRKNDIIIYAPGQFHTQYTDDENSCSYLTIIFDMQIGDISPIKNKVFMADRELYGIIEEFIKGTKDKYDYYHDLLIVDMQKIIVTLLRNNYGTNQPLANTPMQQKFESELLDGILDYISENIYSPLTIEELCKKFSISRSSLQVLFKKNLQIAPKQYISSVKLEYSKKLIKESKYTISEIAAICGFASIHYFSRKFKKEFGVAPIVYAKSFIS